MLENREVWKPIVGHEDKYLVSNYGHVKGVSSMTRTKNHLSFKMFRHGYQFVRLYKDGTRKNTSVHRLVAEAFLENPDNKKCVNHKNGIKSDNRLCNLEMATHSENRVHALENDLTKPQVRPIECITIDRKFDSIKDASHYTGISSASICNHLIGKTKSAGGYIWRYLD